MNKANWNGWHEINQLAIAHVGKPAVHVSNFLGDTDKDEEIWQYVVDQINSMYPVEAVARDYMVGCLHGGLFFFDTMEEARKFYKIFESDLTDSSNIYVSLYAETGKCLTENS
jgi:hypothetical protein